MSVLVALPGWKVHPRRPALLRREPILHHGLRVRLSVGNPTGKIDYRCFSKWSLAFPKEATLIFADGLRKTCRVAWQKRRLLGVAFADGVASTDEQALMMTEEEQALHRQHIGAQLKAAREARGYTEAQIANLVAVSREFVSRAERGKISIPIHQLTHMADLLLVDLDSLVAGPVSIRLPPAESGVDGSAEALLR